MNTDYPYSYSPGGLKSAKRLIGALPETGSTPSILLIGAQFGELAIQIAREFDCRVTAIDANAEAVIYAKMMAQKYGLGAKTDFMFMQPSAMTFSKDAFDIVLSDNVFSLYPRRKVLSEILKILKPGGAVGIMDSYWKKTPVPLYVKNVWESRDNKVPTMIEWQGLIEESGLILEDVRDDSSALDRFYTQFTAEIKSIAHSRFEGMKHYKSLVKQYKHEIDTYFKNGGNKYMGHLTIRAIKPVGSVSSQSPDSSSES